MTTQDVHIKRQAQSLERNLKGLSEQIKHEYNQFRESCRVFNPDRGYSSATINDIKEKFKEVNARVAEARALQALLRSKYKTYVQLDVQKQRELEDMLLMYKKDYRFFEHNQKAWEDRLRARGERPQALISHITELYGKHRDLPCLLLLFQGDPGYLELVGKRIKLGPRDTRDMTDSEAWIFLAGIRAEDDAVLARKLLDTLFKNVSGGMKSVVRRLRQASEWKPEVIDELRRALEGVRDGGLKVV